jgi:serine/threonine protein kinase
LDFGLARLDDSVEISRPGTVVGTPAYMSPEQTRGQELDARSDLFSLGTVLYRLLTGRLPFAGAHTTAVMHAIEEHEPPPPGTLCADLPVDLDVLTRELLAKRTEDRPPSAREVMMRLQAIRIPATSGVPTER